MGFDCRYVVPITQLTYETTPLDQRITEDGNVISPEDILKDFGADILRAWVASSDYAEDLRIDKRWNFKSTSMNFYIDIENLLMSEIPKPPDYGLQRDENQNILNPRNLIEILSENQSSLIPSIGFVFDF